MVPGSRKILMLTKSGFTLIELMIVITIIVVMGLFAAPDLVTFRPNVELNGAARQLYGNLQNTKMAAVRHNSNVVITFNQTIGADTFDYYIFVDTDEDFIPDAGETVLGSFVIADDFEKVSYDTSEGGGDGLTFQDNTVGNPAIGFQPNGIPVAPGGVWPNGSIFLKNDYKAQKVVLNQAGSLSIEDV